MTTDGIINILLVAGLPSVMAVLGTLMAAKALDKAEARKWIVSFIALGFLSVGLAIWQQIRITTQQHEAERESGKRERLVEDKADLSERNRIGDTQYLKGKLDTMSVVMGEISKGLLSGGVSNSAAGITAALGAFAGQSPRETEAKRRADAQAHLGKLLTEGQQLSQCQTIKDGVLPTEAQKRAHEDWTKRTYAALAAEVNPAALSHFGQGYHVSVAPGQEKWLRTLCSATYYKVSDLEGIMAQEFAPLLSEPERQHRAQGRKELARALADGQGLSNKYCEAFPNGNERVPTEVETALSDWEVKAYATLTEYTGTHGIELWQDADNAYPGAQPLIQHRCGKHQIRMRALENAIRSFGL